MRYKFRGKRIDNGEWVYGSLVVQDNKYYILLDINEHIKRDNYEVYMIEVIPETIGQYTDLNDKAGKEIYDGDVVRKLCWNDKLFKDIGKGEYYSYAKVSYIQDLAGFYLVNNEGKICWELGQDKYNIEVCGNIYDNKELLEN